MKNTTYVWPLVVFILGIFAILTVREYLQDQTKIKAEVEKAHCIVAMKKIYPDEDRWGVCEDTKTYKLRGDFIK